MQGGFSFFERFSAAQRSDLFFQKEAVRRGFFDRFLFSVSPERE